MILTTFYKENGEITVNLESSLEVRQSTVDARNESWIDGSFSSEKYYMDNNTAVEKPPKPDKYSIFNYATKEWEYPVNYLSTVKANTQSLVNVVAGEKITSKYPEYKQRNILASNDTEFITATWDWINSIRNLSNTTNDAINNAQNVQEIENIYQHFLSNLTEL